MVEDIANNLTSKTTLYSIIDTVREYMDQHTKDDMYGVRVSKRYQDFEISIHGAVIANSGRGISLSHKTKLS